jgi:hypothetical protein
VDNATIHPKSGNSFFESWRPRLGRAGDLRAADRGRYAPSRAEPLNPYGSAHRTNGYFLFSTGRQKHRQFQFGPRYYVLIENEISTLRRNIAGFALQFTGTYVNAKLDRISSGRSTLRQSAGISSIRSESQQFNGRRCWFKCLSRLAIRRERQSENAPNFPQEEFKYPVVVQILSPRPLFPIQPNRDLWGELPVRLFRRQSLDFAFRTALDT